MSAAPRDRESGSAAAIATAHPLSSRPIPGPPAAADRAPDAAADRAPDAAADRAPDAAADRAPDAAALTAILNDVAAGIYPPADGSITILGQPSERDAGVISFTGCAVVFADADPVWIAAQLPPGDLSAPLSATFLATLAQRLGRRSHSVDMLTCAAALPGRPPEDVRLTELPAGTQSGHDRIARALRYRDDVRAWQAPGGIVLIGRGVAGRWETAIEVDPDRRGRGLGARLARAARHLVPDDVPVWAQIAPANAASARAFLAAGYRPAGAEALLSRATPA